MKIIKLMIVMSLIVTILGAQRYRKSNCEKIRQISYKICSEPVISNKSLDSLLTLYKINENIEASDQQFPKTDKDYKLQYGTMDKIYDHAKKKYECNTFYFKMSFIIRTNVEFSEFIINSIPYLALGNTEGFLKSLSLLNQEQQKDIIFHLRFLYEINKVKFFLNKLSKLQSKKLYWNQIEAIRKELSDL